MIDLLTQNAAAVLAGVACGLVVWGGLRVELYYLRRDVLRAHKRLDLIHAPNVTITGK